MKSQRLQIKRFDGLTVALFSIIFALSFISSGIQADSTLVTQTAYPDSLIKKIDSNIYSIGNVLLDKSTKEIRLPGWVNMDTGLVEYIAVSPEGKTHEAVFVLDIQPLHLQVALLLLGLDFGQNLEFQGDSRMPDGDLVSISVEWISTGEDTIVYPVSKLIYNIQSDSEVPDTKWVFTGSIMVEGNYMADIDGSIIATYSDPNAILNNPLKNRIDDTVYGANKKLLPSRGHKIIMTIKTD